MGDHHYVSCSASRKIIFLILPFISLACASSRIEARRQQYVSTHPVLSVTIKNAVVHGELAGGMSQEEVRASWGEPVAVVTETAADGSAVVRWTYFVKIGSFTKISEVRFVNGTLQTLEGYGTCQVFNPSGETHSDCGR